MKNADGERILLWSFPAVLFLWMAVFFWFPGFLPPMSPALSADEVAAFYRDPANLPRIRYSMIVFNWFCVGLVPVLALLAVQVRHMAHRTPLFAYAIVACAACVPTTFLMASLFWLLAAFRPERDPQLILLFNDMAWVTWTSQAGLQLALAVLLALAIFLDRQARPVFARWVAHFNLLVAAALVPACFAGVTTDGPFAWDGLFGFWLRVVATGAWIVVTGAVLWQTIRQRRLAAGARA